MQTRLAPRSAVLASLLLATAATLACANDASPGEFLTSTGDHRVFAWTPAQRSAAQAFDEAFPAGGGPHWGTVSFQDAQGSVPQPVTREALLQWVDRDLLNGPDPFEAHGGRVPVPWPQQGGLGCVGAWEESGDTCSVLHGATCDTVFDSTSDAICECAPPVPGGSCATGTWKDKDHGLVCGPCKVLAKSMDSHYRTCRAYCAAQETTTQDDQLGVGQWVGYSRRQVCFLVAKSLMGAGTQGYDNGLAQYLEKRGHHQCLPRTGDFGRALFGLLAACAADPGLADGGAGPLVLVVKPQQQPDAETVRARGQGVPLASAGLRVCSYDDGTAGVPGLPRVPAEGCTQPTAAGPGRDFMTHQKLEGQALQDISAEFFGGYVFGNACGLGGGQDERLMTYMPEMAALAFFLSQTPGRPQLRQPAWVLGARMLFKGLDGTARWDHRVEPDPDTPLVSDLVRVELGGKAYNISSSRPFIAFMSESQGSLTRHQPIVKLARRNKHPQQREFDPQSWFAFDKQVRAWSWSVALSSYPEAMRPTLKALVKSLGTGPWLAGLWWGDSQLGLLATWIAHAIAAPSWGEAAAPFPLDYYLYSSFTENPGNQCFVHSQANCRACQRRCLAHPLPSSAYWMPNDAFFGHGPCAYQDSSDCGQAGLEDVYAAYASRTAPELWADVERALRHNNYRTDRSVFDLLLSPGIASTANATIFP